MPRRLTFEVPERIGVGGRVVKPLDERAVETIIDELIARDVEAVAVCLLWSIANPAHELRVGELLEERLQGRPFTLSHQLNPALREYRRASSTAIDASLKPLMTEYLGGLTERLRAAGLQGRVLLVTAAGGAREAGQLAEAPIHSIGSGPAMAPVAGRFYAEADGGRDTAVVADTGGTSYDVGLVRHGRIPWTRETWLGPRYRGHMTGFPSVDVKSIGTGGGSIASVDDGGMLHVGPESAGAKPGPACYGRGGARPTVTDASVVLGYIDSDFFLGGRMTLDRAASERVLAELGEALELDAAAAAAAVLRLATENMVRAIESITLNQGIDPRGAALVAGGGAAGLNAVSIARRLGSPEVIIPQTAAVLSAAGALISDLASDYSSTFASSSEQFDFDGVNAVLAELETRCEVFVAEAGDAVRSSTVEYFAEARYPHQVWEIEVPLRGARLPDADAVAGLREDFHALHHDIFKINDPAAHIDTVSWRARVSCRLREDPEPSAPVFADATANGETRSRPVHFPGHGFVDASVHLFESMAPGTRVEGPAVVESSVTSIVLEPGSVGERRSSGSLVVTP